MPELAMLIFLVNHGFLATHELDAIQQHEWRFFNIPFRFSDTIAYRLYTALHIPLFAWVIGSAPDRTFQIGFDLFLIFHAGLHFALRNHPTITFNNPFSRFLIYGGVPFAVIHLALLLAR